MAAQVCIRRGSRLESPTSPLLSTAFPVLSFHTSRQWTTSSSIQARKRKERSKWTRWKSNLGEKTSQDLFQQTWSRATTSNWSVISYSCRLPTLHYLEIQSVSRRKEKKRKEKVFQSFIVELQLCGAHIIRVRVRVTLHTEYGSTTTTTLIGSDDLRTI